MSDWRNKAALSAEYDRDMAHALDWWQNTPEQHKVKLWELIQKHHADPYMECMSRMAQLGMTAVAIAALNDESRNP